MSAIFGIYNLSGKPVCDRLLIEMSDILAHRGGDAANVWSAGNIGFGHRMQWTTRESLGEKLPNGICGNNFAITADARIDNRDDLLRRLNLFERAASDSISDSEIIVWAYEKWGEDCTKHLIGDFAFAIWDARQQTVFCARDHFGVKSLYYYFSNDIFVFATEIKALLQVPEVPRALNETKLGDYLTAVYDDVAATFYKDIFRLPASSQMIVNRGGKQIKTYWSLDPQRELRLNSDAEYAENFRELFAEAVACRMRSVYPIGSMLSGGMDSSSVACTARKLMLEKEANLQSGQTKLHTFSAVFEKTAKSDESFYINAVLRQGDFEPHILKADSVSPLADLEKIIWHQDEAIQLGNLYINWHLYGAAQKSGVRVILDGFDGDTTVSHGTKLLLELARAKKWTKLFGEARGYAKNFDESFAALMWAYYWRFGLEPKLNKKRAFSPLRRAGRKLYERALTKDRFAPLRADQFDYDLNPDFVRQTNLAEHQQRLKEQRPRAARTEREDHYIQFLKGVTPFLLETIDKAAAPFGVEVRYPFWDIRLSEFCLSLPAEQKMHRGYTRMVMRRAMQNILPAEVQWRRGKSDLSHGFNQSLQHFEQSRLLDTFKTDSQILGKYINVAALPETYRRLSNGEATVADVLKLSSSVSLALWLQNARLTN